MLSGHEMGSVAPIHRSSLRSSRLDVSRPESKEPTYLPQAIPHMQVGFRGEERASGGQEPYARPQEPFRQEHYVPSRLVPLHQEVGRSAPGFSVLGGAWLSDASAHALAAAYEP